MSTLTRFKIIAVFLLFFICSAVQAQFNADKYEKIQLLKEVPLLVVLENPNEKIVKKLTKKDPETAERYRAEVKAKNGIIKTTINSTWKISNDVKFITPEELEKYKIKENEGKYAYLTSKVYNKVKSNKSDSGYLAYCNYSIYIIGDFTPFHEMRYSTEYGETIVSKADVETIWSDMQSNFKNKESQVAKRIAKKDLRKNTGYAKTKFSDDE